MSAYLIDVNKYKVDVFDKCASLLEKGDELTSLEILKDAISFVDDVVNNGEELEE